MFFQRLAGILLFTALLAAGCGDDAADVSTTDESDTSAVEDTVPEETLPEGTLPEDTLPEDTLPEDTLPEDTAPVDTAPESTVVDDPADEDTGEFAYDDPDAYYLVEQLTPELGGVAETREGAIVLGTQDAYVVDYTNCCTDDTLSVNISSLEDNAVFAIYGPDGQMLAAELTSENLLLEQGGEFWIIVGSVRGNATYTIEIGLSQSAS